MKMKWIAVIAAALSSQVLADSVSFTFEGSQFVVQAQRPPIDVPNEEQRPAEDFETSGIVSLGDGFTASFYVRDELWTVDDGTEQGLEVPGQLVALELAQDGQFVDMIWTGRTYGDFAFDGSNPFFRTNDAMDASPVFQVPEPATLTLLASSLCLAGRRRLAV